MSRDGAAPPAPLEHVARTYGTPVHVLDAQRLRANYRALRGVLDALPVRTRVFYSVKTNYLPYLLRELAALGAGADVVSGYELRAALDAGVDGRDVVFNGPMKTRDEIFAAVAAGALVNVDPVTDVGHLDDAAARAGRTLDVGVRVNPQMNVYPSSDPEHDARARTAALASRFGWPLGTRVVDVVGRVEASPHLRLTQLHMHLGSQITDHDALAAAAGEVVELFASLRRDHPLEVLNVGGGFGVPGIVRPRGADARRRAFDVGAFFTAVARRLVERGCGDATLACEPGRLLVSDAMCLVTGVAAVKRTSDARWVVLDGGHNVAPWAGTGERHGIRALTASGAPEPWSVSGPLCFEGDVHGHDVVLPSGISPGDLVVVEDTGAYSLGRSNNFIRMRAPVVVVDGDREPALVWRRETYEDVFAFACDPHAQAADGPSRAERA